MSITINSRQLVIQTPNTIVCLGGFWTKPLFDRSSHEVRIEAGPISFIRFFD